jgi:hypothetical protein
MFALVKDRLSVAIAASALGVMVPVIRIACVSRTPSRGRAAGMPLVEIVAGWQRAWSELSRG